MLKKILIEYHGAYDGCLAYFYENEPEKLYHRISNNLITEKYSSKEYGPIYFKTNDGRFFSNLTEIPEEDFIRNKPSNTKDCRKI